MNAISQKVYDSILRDIGTGRFEVGGRIPTELELAERFETNRMNVHRAVTRLTAEGVVERRKRGGSFVAKGLSEAAVADLRNSSASQVHVFYNAQSLSSYSHWGEATFNELEKVLSKHGIRVLYSSIATSRKGLKSGVDKMLVSGSRALIFFPSRVEMDFMLEQLDILSDPRMNAFIVNRGFIPAESIPCHSISFDPFGEGAMAAKFLWEKYRRPTIFMATERPSGQFYWQTMRGEGAAKMLRAIGGGELRMLTVSEDSDVGQTLASLCADNPGVGVIAENDHMAARLMEGGKNAGLSPMNDFRLISFDNDPLFLVHNLTTITPPVGQLGGNLARLLVEGRWDLITGTHVSLRIQSQIVERATA